LDSSGLAGLIATQIGFGGTLGFLLGYGLKKVATIVLKAVALVSAIFMLFLAWLASVGVVSISFGAFSDLVENGFAGITAALFSSLTFIAQVLPMSGSFGLGFYVGAKKG